VAEEIIRETISVSRTSLTEHDKEISALYGRVVSVGLDHAMWLLAWGTPAEKLRVATAAMASAARLAAVDSKAEMEEHRLEFQRTLDEITSVVERDLIVSGPDAPPILEFIDAQTETLAGRADD